MRRIPAGVPTGGQFATTARTEAAVALAEPPSPTPHAHPYLAQRHVVDQFMYGDCLHLADALARRNGWGVLVVGDAEYDEEWECWETDRIQHAFAVRPDGLLVDIRGVHDPAVAEALAAQVAAGAHRYDDADAAEAVWCVSVLELAGEEDPEEIASLISDPHTATPAPTQQEVEDWTRDFFDSEYGELFAEACETSSTAAGLCVDVSESFADYLADRGEDDVRLVDLDATEDHEYVPAGSPHTVVEVRGTIIDLTHRQFDPDAALPLSAPKGEFLAGWRVVSYD